MIVSLRTITIVVFSLYFILTFYAGYILLKSNNAGSKDSHLTYRKWSLPDDGEDWNPWGEEFEHEKKSFAFVQKEKSGKWWTNETQNFRKSHKTKLDVSNEPLQYNVEIWGKAAIGLYLWEHILNAKIENKGVWSYGFKKIENLKFKFRTGPGLITTKAPSDVQNLVLVLNGRSEEKVSFARMWLDFLPQFRNLKNTILIILGNEQCENEWLVPYTAKAGGLINTTLIVYDAKLVDNVNFYQWPLGVATYRGFPKVDPKKLDIENARPYICNFLGSIYPQSSREKLLQIIREHNLTQYCFIKVRHEWQPRETKNSLSLYIESLGLSDLTLSPVGINTECYRIYEAVSFGSVPVVENVMTPGLCGNSKGILAASPLRLLKTLNAPFIYINDWSELPHIIMQELKMPLQEKINRRIRLVQWYENFKLYFREHLLSVIKDNISRRER